MSKRNTHYERAFEDLLQQRGIPYVAVDQAQKAVFSGASIKSFDFIVYPNRGPKILADVKGRKCPWRQFQRGRWGETWITKDDLDGLHRWEEVFGPDYLAAFVFAYWLFDGDLPAQTNGAVHRFAQRDYAFVVAELTAYHLRSRCRSPRWHTVYVPAAKFGDLAQPLDLFLAGGQAGKCPQKSPTGS